MFQHFFKSKPELGHFCKHCTYACNCGAKEADCLECSICHRQKDMIAQVWIDRILKEPEQAKKAEIVEVQDWELI